MSQLRRGTRPSSACCLVAASIWCLLSTAAHAARGLRQDTQPASPSPPCLVCVILINENNPTTPDVAVDACIALSSFLNNLPLSPGGFTCHSGSIANTDIADSITACSPELAPQDATFFLQYAKQNAATHLAELADMCSEGTFQLQYISSSSTDCGAPFATPGGICTKGKPRVAAPAPSPEDDGGFGGAPTCGLCANLLVSRSPQLYMNLTNCQQLAQSLTQFAVSTYGSSFGSSFVCDPNSGYQPNSGGGLYEGLMVCARGLSQASFSTFLSDIAKAGEGWTGIQFMAPTCAPSGKQFTGQFFPSGGCTGSVQNVGGVCTPGALPGPASSPPPPSGPVDMPCQLCALMNFNARGYPSTVPQCTAFAAALPALYPGFQFSWVCQLPIPGNIVSACTSVDALASRAFLQQFFTNSAAANSIFLNFAPFTCQQGGSSNYDFYSARVLTTQVGVDCGAGLVGNPWHC